ncbi:MAG: DUF3024 domain-containing protein [Desulfobulbaceae bacterium]|nr:DUF3024 domain-containing protein [Desulfobulbaceae bacterium]
MAFSEFEIKRIEKLIGKCVGSRRPPGHSSKQPDFSFRIAGQSFEIFETRAQLNDPTKILAQPIAKATYIKNRKMWALFWMRADLKWQSYKLFPVSGSLEKILETIAQDRFDCFWG